MICDIIFVLTSHSLFVVLQSGNNTWFQRHREPHTLTDTHEESDMMSFEFEVTPHTSGMPGKTSGWCQRLMKNFVFKYEFLEDEL